MQIGKKTLLGDILRNHRGARDVLVSMGMHFVCFPSAHRESLEDACSIYDLEVDHVLKRLEAFA